MGGASGYVMCTESAHTMPGHLGKDLGPPGVERSKRKGRQEGPRPEQYLHYRRVTGVPNTDL